MTVSTERSNSFSGFIATAPEQRDGVPFVLTPPSAEILKDAKVSEQNIFVSKSSIRGERGEASVGNQSHLIFATCISIAY